MSTEEQEPKQDVEELDIDAKLDELENQSSEDQPSQESSPEKSETSEAEGSETDSPKTEEPQAEDEDKGFADHPAWKKREEKLKQAREEAEKLKQESEKFNSLLNDPDVYKKYLTRQGLSDFEINQKMQERGFETVKTEKTQMFDRVAKKLGWDTQRITPEQRQQINDLIAINEAVSDEIVSERTEDLRSHVTKAQAEKSLDAGIREAKELASKENVNWELAEKAMNDYLVERDKRTGRQDYIDPVELYQLATRNISQFRTDSDSRKKERDALKKNARPLASTGAGVQPDQKMDLSKGIGPAVDKFLDEAGYKE